MKHPDIVCIGTGRSGTSFIAKVLAERLGVCWGKGIDPRPQGALESGKWEDAYMRTHNLNLEQNMITPHQWVMWWEKAHENCDEGAGTRWIDDKIAEEHKPFRYHGVKDPRLALINPMAWKYIRPGLIVEGWRTEEQVIASRRRKSTKIYDDLMHQGGQAVAKDLLSYWEWYEEMCRYNLGMLQYLTGSLAYDMRILYVQIDMSEPRTAEEIVEEVEGYLP